MRGSRRSTRAPARSSERKSRSARVLDRREEDGAGPAPVDAFRRRPRLPSRATATASSRRLTAGRAGVDLADPGVPDGLDRAVPSFFRARVQPRRRHSACTSRAQSWKSAPRSGTFATITPLLAGSPAGAATAMAPCATDDPHGTRPDRRSVPDHPHPAVRRCGEEVRRRGRMLTTWWNPMQGTTTRIYLSRTALTHDERHGLRLAARHVGDVPEVEC